MSEVLTCAKSLLAVAIAAAVPAVASAQVVVSGIMKAGVASTKYSGSEALSSPNGNGLGVSDGSSRILIGGTEEIVKGGLRAMFQVDFRVRIDDNGGTADNNANGTINRRTTAWNASQLGTGNTFIGIADSWGMVRIGKLDTHYCAGSDQHGTRATALQASSCALLGYVNGSGAGNAIANASRSTNIINYVSPTIQGFALGLSHSTAWQGNTFWAPDAAANTAGTYGQTGSEGPLDGQGKGGAMNVRLDYAQGPIKAGATWWDATGENKNKGSNPTDTTEVRYRRSAQEGLTVYGDYSFGMGSIGLTWDRSSTSSAGQNVEFLKSERTVVSVPVTLKVGGPGTILATWSRASNIDRSGTPTSTAPLGTAAGTDATLISIGYNHDFSKRTSLGISYAKLNNGAAGSYGLYTQTSLAGHTVPVAGQDQQQFYAGLRHTF